MGEPLVQWAVVGLGRHAREYMLPAFRRSRKAKLVAVYTRTDAVRRQIAAEYAVRDYATLEALLDDPAIDVIYLATPHDLHSPQTLACAKAQKHVLVEKPMTISSSDAADMVEACAQAGVKLLVGFQLRHHPAHQRMRELIADGAIGDVVHVSGRWASYRDPDTGWKLDLDRAGGTLLTARGVHLIDLIRFVCGSEYTTIAGLSDGLRADRQADTVTSGLAKLASGAVAHFLCTRLVPGAEDGLEIYGTRGTLVSTSTVAVQPQGTLALSIDSKRTELSYDACDLFPAQIDSVSDAVRGAESRTLAFGEDGLRVVSVTEALLLSVKTGRTVVVGGQVPGGF